MALLARAPLSGQADKFQENINVMVVELEGEVDLGTFFELNKEQMLARFPDKSEPNEEEMYAGFLRGKGVSFHGKLDGREVVVQSAMWKKDRRFYLVSSIAQAKDTFRYSPIFKKIIRSLRMK